MCKKISFILALITLFSSFSLTVSALSTSAKSAILIEKESGDIIYEKNASVPLPIASTTKIMTAIVAIESGELDRKIKIPIEATNIEGSSIYLKEGEELSLRELLYALLLESANDASVAIAYLTCGDVSEFVQKMNEKASILGLENTHFTNPHGLYDKEHYSSAYDMARLTSYALNNPVFKEICATKTYKIPSPDGQRLLVNHNRLLRMYDGANGVKTGFTKISGRCLVSSAKRDGVELIAVTLNAPNDWRDHTSLFDYGFSLYENITLADNGSYLVEIPLNGASKDSILSTNIEKFSKTIKKGAGNFSASVNYDPKLPISRGDVLGQIHFYDDEMEIGRIDLVSLENARLPSNKTRISNLFERLFKNGKN